MLKGKVKAVKPNQTNTEVIIELPGGIGCDIHHHQGVSPELATDQWQGSACCYQGIRRDVAVDRSGWRRRRRGVAASGRAAGSLAGHRARRLARATG